MSNKDHFIVINWTTRQVAGVFLTRKEADDVVYKKLLANEDGWIIEERKGYKKEK